MISKTLIRGNDKRAFTGFFPTSTISKTTGNVTELELVAFALQGTPSYIKTNIGPSLCLEA